MSEKEHSLEKQRKNGILFQHCQQHYVEELGFSQDSSPMTKIQIVVLLTVSMMRNSSNR